MEKEAIVLGDVEMGGGNLTDDFICDKALSELINQQSKKKGNIDLIFNGDTFDFLKCPYIDDKGNKSFPRHITAEISLGKMKLVYEAHKPVFQALSKFVKIKNHNLYFIIGNHDHDLFFPELQEEIKRLIGTPQRVHFPGLSYKQDGLYVEHGQQYDFLHRINFESLFLNYKGKSLLNFPWASFGLISTFMDLKEEHPFLERISPRPLLLSLHHMVLRKISLRSIGYFFKSVLYYPFRYYADPTYNFPQKLFGEFYYRLKNRHFDVDDIIDVFRKEKKKLTTKVHVLGHIHKTYEQKEQGKAIIHPGSWKDEYVLDAKTRVLNPKKKYYVQVKIKDKKIDYTLQEIPNKRSALLFDDVRKNEHSYLHLAAWEEGYQLKI
ncbi:metallophosphoesterase [Candidatus Woesearchaeota archaeon]|nr:metallophosphoesterase [Candidatus Woesearchaeota archaeon]